jgi:hypothetical protein
MLLRLVHLVKTHNKASHLLHCFVVWQILPAGKFCRANPAGQILPGKSCRANPARQILRGKSCQATNPARQQVLLGKSCRANVIETRNTLPRIKFIVRQTKKMSAKQTIKKTHQTKHHTIVNRIFPREYERRSTVTRDTQRHAPLRSYPLKTKTTPPNTPRITPYLHQRI